MSSMITPRTWHPCRADPSFSLIPLLAEQRTRRMPSRRRSIAGKDGLRMKRRGRRDVFGVVLESGVLSGKQVDCRLGTQCSGSEALRESLHSCLSKCPPLIVDY
ncbi:predicted protein [Verticillium alfalfae VaMs.102]|uniref:Predicted protein n=1 Tax=Verticillium alfalfae (strain VaMs.102 / ATCC MYA-4576 / FGSC 10136) TaxID=526221 RepID=C9SAC8_VERA1|nr:predicted protein [Verticillium alfalfae VaMs.102]EEY15405.1 predicted protein [Verticillium alfalfae VaMs.102]